MTTLLGWARGSIIKQFLDRNIKKCPDLHSKIIYHNPVKGDDMEVCITLCEKWGLNQGGIQPSVKGGLQWLVYNPCEKGYLWFCVQLPLEKGLTGVLQHPSERKVKTLWVL